MTPNQKAFLDMLAASEIGAALLSISDNGYNVCVGSTPGRPLLFDLTGPHPRRHDTYTNSDAAGRYQLMGRYFLPYTKQLGLDGTMSKANQDAIALQQIKECRALAAIEAGDLPTAIAKCAHIWASLPGAGYGQHENALTMLTLVFNSAGGIVA